MHLFINASAASAGGGLTYLRNILPPLSNRSGLKTTILASAEFPEIPDRYPGITLVTPAATGKSVLRRFWNEQATLPALLRRSGCDVLLSAGNMALFRSPVPQILLARNALYTSRDFYADTRSRGDLRLWLNTLIQGWVARRSLFQASQVVAPSEAFAAELRQWIGGRQARIAAIPHGFDPAHFCADPAPLPEAIRRKLMPESDCLRLLFVSHYNYFRNFETLVRAIPLLKSRLPGKRIRLVLTCRLHPSPQWGPYDARRIEKLVEKLGIAQDLVELDLVPYSRIHHVYRACDIYVSAAYAESFAHPLVEAMACGLPVAASDLPVHREVCGAAARYFPRFSPEALADCVAQIALSPEQASDQRKHGQARAHDFSWEKHVEALMALAARLAGGRRSPIPDQGAGLRDPAQADMNRRMAGERQPIVKAGIHG